MFIAKKKKGVKCDLKTSYFICICWLHVFLCVKFTEYVLAIKSNIPKNVTSDVLMSLESRFYVIKT